MITAISPVISYFIDLPFLSFEINRALKINIIKKENLSENKHEMIIIKTSKVMWMAALFGFISGSRPPFNYVYIFILPVVFFAIYSLSLAITRHISISTCLYHIVKNEKNIIDDAIYSSSEVFIHLDKLRRDNNVFINFVAFLLAITSSIIFFMQYDSVTSRLFYSVFAVELIFTLSLFSKGVVLNIFILIISLSRTTDERDSKEILDINLMRIFTRYHFSRFLMVIPFILAILSFGFLVRYCI
jgi:hypothetical protein